jgi:hypothetical protein
MWVNVLHTVTGQVGAADARLVIVSNFSSGWFLNLSNGNKAMAAAIYRVGPASVVSPTFTVTAGMVGKLLSTHIVYDVAGAVLRHYTQAVENGSGTAVASAYIPPLSSLRMAVGAQTGGSAPASQNVIHGIVGGDGFVPTAGEITANYAAQQAAVAAGTDPMIAIPGKTTYLRNFNSPWTGTYVPSPGTGTLSGYAGTATNIPLVTNAAPTWA